MNFGQRGDTGGMDIMGWDVVVVELVGILVWCLLMLGVQMGDAMTEAYAQRKR
jgi:hypothetical protein